MHKLMESARLYFDMDHPHNVNIIMTLSPDGTTMIKVWNRHRKTFVDYDICLAVDEMLEEHGQAIRNFPDEVQPAPPRAVIKQIEFEYQRQNHKSANLVRMMNDLAKAKLNENYKQLENSLKYLDILDNMQKSLA